MFVCSSFEASPADVAVAGNAETPGFLMAVFCIRLYGKPTLPSTQTFCKEIRKIKSTGMNQIKLRNSTSMQHTPTQITKY